MSNVDKTFIEQITDSDIDNLIGVGVGSEAVLTTGDDKTNINAEGAQKKDEPSFTKGLDDDPLDYNELLKESGQTFEADEDAADVLGKLNSTKEPEVEQNSEPKDSVDFDALAKELIEDGLLLGGFEDDAPIKSKKDLKELIKGNLEEYKSKVVQEEVVNFINSLPNELKIAADYALSGGTNMKDLFKTLSRIEEAKQHTLDDEDGQEAIVRDWLGTQGFSSEEIEQEVFEMKDSGKLEARAKFFKPKLDSMYEKEVQVKIEQEKQATAKRVEFQKQYQENVYNALKDGDLNGIKLDKKLSNNLYSGLTENTFDSISGGKTNMLGALLEKVQYIEPDYKLLAEATWLLADPKGYKEKIKSEIKQEVTADTVRKIKTANESSKAGTSATQSLDSPKPKIKRSGFFKL